MDDPNVAMEEVHRPDGWIEKNAGKELTIRRDTDAATGQLQMMTLDAQTIQKSVGISPRTWGARPMRTQALPSRGARTKAASPPRSHSTTSCWPSRPGPETTEHGRAVLHRGKGDPPDRRQGKMEVGEDQPTQAATEWKRALPERHHRVHGRLRGVRRDYNGSLRQAMFESMNAIVQKLPPEIGLRLFAMAMDYSDLPNADEIASEIRRMVGARDPDEPMTPEEAQQQEQDMRQRLEAMEVQRQQSALAVENNVPRCANSTPRPPRSRPGRNRPARM